MTGCHEPDTSVLQQDKTVLQTHTDSIEWYVRKYSQKERMNERDSAIHYLKEAFRFRLVSESYAFGRIGMQYEALGKSDSAVAAYFRALVKMEGKDSTSVNDTIFEMKMIAR